MLTVPLSESLLGFHDVLAVKNLAELRLLGVVYGFVLGLKLLEARFGFHKVLEPLLRQVRASYKFFDRALVLKDGQHRDASRSLFLSPVPDGQHVGFHVEEEFAEHGAIVQAVEISLLVRCNDLVERRAEVLYRVLNSPVLHVKVKELISVDGLSLIWEYFLDELDDVIVANVAASVLGHHLPFRDHEVEQTSEDAVEEEVQLVAIELLLGLEAEE